MQFKTMHLSTALVIIQFCMLYIYIVHLLFIDNTYYNNYTTDDTHFSQL